MAATTSDDDDDDEDDDEDDDDVDGCCNNKDCMPVATLFSPHQLHVVHLLQFQFLPWTLFLFADFDFPFGFPFLACYAPGKHAKIQIIFYCLNSINGGAGKALEIKITRDCLRFHSVLRALQLHDVSECISIPNLYLNLKRSWQLLLWGSSNESEAR